MESKGRWYLVQGNNISYLGNGNDIGDIGQRIMRDIEGELRQKNLFILDGSQVSGHKLVMANNPST